jgi:hypothetical protein
MANESFQPYSGPTTIDLQAIASILIDLHPGAMKSLRSEKEGIIEVINELSQNVPTIGAKAGISPEIYAEFVAANDNLTKIRAVRAVVSKLAEVLEESEAYYEHLRENSVSIISDSVRSAAHRKGDAIKASFEKTLKYNSQYADKAAKTRRKNAKAGAAAASEVQATDAAASGTEANTVADAAAGGP